VPLGTNREITKWAWGLFGPDRSPLFFRSLFGEVLLPLVGPFIGGVIAILVTALLFSILHQPRTAAKHWAWVFATGCRLGLDSIDVMFATCRALRHIAYNSTLLLWLEL